MSEMQVTLEDLYTIIGELEIVRRKLNFQVQSLLKQTDEMSAEITKLREENGKLGKPDNHE